MAKDQMRLGPEIEPGHGAAVRRGADGKIVGFGTFTTVKDGQPIPEGVELIHVGAEDDDGWRDVTTLYGREPERSAPERNGPAQVATPAYRNGYDRIFSKKREVGLA